MVKLRKRVLCVRMPCGVVGRFAESVEARETGRKHSNVVVCQNFPSNWFQIFPYSMNVLRYSTSDKYKKKYVD